MNRNVEPRASSNPFWLRRFTHKQEIAVAALRASQPFVTRNVYLVGFVESCAPFIGGSPRNSATVEGLTLRPLGLNRGLDQ